MSWRARRPALAQIAGRRRGRAWSQRREARTKTNGFTVGTAPSRVSGRREVFAGVGSITAGRVERAVALVRDDVGALRARRRQPRPRRKWGDDGGACDEVGWMSFERRPVPVGLQERRHTVPKGPLPSTSPGAVALQSMPR